MGTEFFHAGGRTDMTKLKVAFRIFANSPKVVKFSSPTLLRRIMGSGGITPLNLNLDTKILRPTSHAITCTSTNDKVVPAHTMRECRSGGIAPLILTLSNVTSCTHRIEVWVGVRTGLNDLDHKQIS